jgi:hypothetical protein
MKRPLKPDLMRLATGDIKLDLSAAQLEGIGLATIGYNYAEAQIDILLGAALGLDLDSSVERHVTTRINGVDGKIAIITFVAERLGIDDAIRRDIEDSLGDGVFKRFKKYRDAIIHARVLDAEMELGHVVERQAKQSEVLLTTGALNLLYQHLNALRFELHELTMAFFHKRVAVVEFMAMKDAHKRPPYEAVFQEWIARFRDRRTKRQALPPLPEFPPEREWIEIRAFPKDDKGLE